MSKTERIALRDATYTEPELPERRCETCEYFQWDDESSLRWVPNASLALAFRRLW